MYVSLLHHTHNPYLCYTIAMKLHFGLLALSLFVTTLWAGTENLLVGTPALCDQVIDRPCFTVGYSHAHGQALWVQYRFTAEENRNRKHKRTNLFLPDPELRFKAPDHKDYLSATYSRGHLAPAADMQHSAEAMEASFYLTNISPQHREMNSGIWADIEKFVRYTVKIERSIYVVTGPIFDAKTKPIATSQIPIPNAFYKIIYDTTPPQKMIAFRVPNRPSNAPINSFVTTVDAIERETGLNFFSLVPEAEPLEATTNPDAWKKLNTWVRENL